MYAVISYNPEKAIMPQIIGKLILVLFSTALFTYFMNCIIKALKKKLLGKRVIAGETVIAQGLANHFRGIITDGGAVYLFSDKLVFVPHKMNLFGKEVSILFSEVESIIDYKVLGIFNTGFKIIKKSGKVEKFVVDKTTHFYKMISKVNRK
jgi:hypothetical protein